MLRIGDDGHSPSGSYDLHFKLLPKFPEIQPEDLKLVIEEIALTNPKARALIPLRLSTTECCVKWQNRDLPGSFIDNVE